MSLVEGVGYLLVPGFPEPFYESFVGPVITPLVIAVHQQNPNRVETRNRASCICSDR